MSSSKFGVSPRSSPTNKSYWKPCVKSIRKIFKPIINQATGLKPYFNNITNFDILALLIRWLEYSTLIPFAFVGNFDWWLLGAYTDLNGWRNTGFTLLNDWQILKWT